VAAEDPAFRADAELSKLAVNWALNELFGLLKAGTNPHFNAQDLKENVDYAGTPLSVDESPVDPARLAGLLALVQNGTISGKIGKDVLGLMFHAETDASAAEIVEARGWKQLTDRAAIAALAGEVLADPKHAKQVEQYRAGKVQLFGFFVGKLLAASHGRASPEISNDVLEELLK
jgi:aspartyl-tRNA(Asn)/glutamyl-tRNA(Gln) amidotransferase subunit B